jgi:hypothetical protein
VKTSCYAEASQDSLHLRFTAPKAGGADGDQTHDLVVANDALYQLSYCPESREGQVLGNGRV